MGLSSTIEEFDWLIIRNIIFILLEYYYFLMRKRQAPQRRKAGAEALTRAVIFVWYSCWCTVMPYPAHKREHSDRHVFCIPLARAEKHPA